MLDVDVSGFGAAVEGREIVQGREAPRRDRVTQTDMSEGCARSSRISMTHPRDATSSLVGKDRTGPAGRNELGVAYSIFS